MSVSYIREQSLQNCSEKGLSIPALYVSSLAERLSLFPLQKVVYATTKKQLTEQELNVPRSPMRTLQRALQPEFQTSTLARAWFNLHNYRCRDLEVENVDTQYVKMTRQILRKSGKMDECVTRCFRYPSFFNSDEIESFKEDKSRK